MNDKYLTGMSYGQSGGPQSISWKRQSTHLNPRIHREAKPKNKPMEQINILTTPKKDILAAFELLEGPGMPRGEGETLDTAFECFSTEREKLKKKLLAELSRHAGIAFDSIGDKRTRNLQYARDLRIEIAELDTEPGSAISMIIYGAGGSHRFYVRDNGDIEFSTHHAYRTEDWDNAEALGFRVVRRHLASVLG